MTDTLRKALEPFAKMMDALDAIHADKLSEEQTPDHRAIFQTWGLAGTDKSAELTIGDLRRARAALASPEPASGRDAGLEATDWRDMLAVFARELIEHLDANPRYTIDAGSDIVQLMRCALGLPLDDVLLRGRAQSWRERYAVRFDAIRALKDKAEEKEI